MWLCSLRPIASLDSPKQAPKQALLNGLGHGEKVSLWAGRPHALFPSSSSTWSASQNKSGIVTRHSDFHQAHFSANGEPRRDWPVGHEWAGSLFGRPDSNMSQKSGTRRRGSKEWGICGAKYRQRSAASVEMRRKRRKKSRRMQSSKKIPLVPAAVKNSSTPQEREKKCSLTSLSKLFTCRRKIPRVHVGKKRSRILETMNAQFLITNWIGRREKESVFDLYTFFFFFPRHETYETEFFRALF